MTPDMLQWAGVEETPARRMILTYGVRLDDAMGVLDIVPHFSPIGQVIKSLISSRTRDPVSLAAYHRLGAHFGSVSAMADAGAHEIEPLIADVTFPDVKAERLVRMLAMVRAERPGFKLHFLAERPIPAALAWLERLPGVARKVAASALNFSTLRLPVFVVDTHVLRLCMRLGIVPRGADIRVCSDTVTTAMPDWTGPQFASFHSQLKRLGQQICRWDVPECARCPLAEVCPKIL